jgi:hypothetical protein
MTVELIRLKHKNGAVVPKLDHVTAREHAVALLKKAGFILHQVSQCSTTVYYLHPARTPYLLRVADHRSKRDIIGQPNTVARLTISPKDQYLTELHIENLVATAIGRYFLNEPKPTRYYGKRGTWEDCQTENL